MSTTTTTTTLPPRPLSLKDVNTVIVYNGGTSIGTDSSDSKGTLKTIDSSALSFGPLAPGQTSDTFIIYLKVPTSIAINNIKIALIDNGGFNFADTIFGVEVRSSLDYNVIPSGKFDGVNSTDDPNSVYNVNVGNMDQYTSQYVYLNVVVPENQLMESGVIRYKWWMDYS